MAGLRVLIGACALSVVILVAEGFPSSHTEDSTTAVDHAQSASEPETQLQPDYETSDTNQPSEQSEPQHESQNFFPSFSAFNQPLGHSRPFYYQQEAAYSQRPATYNQQLSYDQPKYANNPFRRDNFQVASDSNSQSILGSGNFGVIRGGTFYNENDEQADYSNGRYYYSNPQFYNNGHGRPTFYFGATNPRPQQHEQFANFRDFADINISNSPDYSHFVVVYVNKNGTKVEAPEDAAVEPKNIIERLAMLDLEVKNRQLNPKKLSKSKRKLALVPAEKKVKAKTQTTTSPTDMYEPLLALS